MVDAAGPVSRPKVDKTLKIQVERGSGFDFDDLMFAGWDGGAVYEYGMFEARDLEQMLSQDGKAESIYKLLTLPILSATWSIEAADGDRGEAEWIDTFLHTPANQGGMSTPLDTVLAQALSARLYRKAYFEKVFKLNAKGEFVYDKLAFRPPSTCGIRRDPNTGAFRGFQQRPVRPGISANMLPIDIEPQYCWVHVNGTDRDPIRGFSDMQVVYWNHVTKLKLMFLWHTFLQTQATPRTIVQGKDPAAAKENAKIVGKIKNGGVIGIGPTDNVTTLESNGTGAKLFQDALEWLDKQATASVLAGFADLTSASHGSYALSKDQSDFFLKSSQKAAKELACSFSNYVLPDLLRLNFGPDAKVPYFEFAPLAESDLTTLSTLVTSLAVAPQLNVPYAFLGELVTKTANYLNLDEAKVEKALEEGAKQYEARLATAQQGAQNAADSAKLAGQVSTAKAMVMQAQAQDKGGNDANGTSQGAGGSGGVRNGAGVQSGSGQQRG